MEERHKKGAGCELVDSGRLKDIFGRFLRPGGRRKWRPKWGVAESGRSSIMLSAGCRGGCWKEFADEEAIETHTLQHTPIRFVDGWKEFADEEAIETDRVCVSYDCYLHCWKEFADEEAIETRQVVGRPTKRPVMLERVR